MFSKGNKKRGRLLQKDGGRLLLKKIGKVQGAKPDKGHREKVVKVMNFRVVSGCFQKGFQGIFSVCFRVLSGCFQGIFSVFSGYFQGVFRVFSGCFLGVQGIFSVCVCVFRVFFPMPGMPFGPFQSLRRAGGLKKEPCASVEVLIFLSLLSWISLLFCLSRNSLFSLPFFGGGQTCNN